MARKPVEGWNVQHNKRPIKLSMKDLRRRRARRIVQANYRKLLSWYAAVISA